VPQLLLLVNKALASFDFRALSDRIAATYRTPVGAVLPLSEDMVRLGSGGIFSVLDPGSAYAEGLRTLADFLESC
jgi:hypothetical protein